MNNPIYIVKLNTTNYDFGKTQTSEIKLVTTDHNKAEALVDKLHEDFRNSQMDEENPHLHSIEENAEIITVELEKQY